MTGCGTKIENAYDTYSTDYINGYNGSNYFASNLCVTNDVNFGQDNMQFAKTAEGAGAFNIDTHQVLYSQNLFEKLYPASTTKILTAYIILKNCDLNATVTVSHDAANPGHSSSVCGLKEGDVITVQDLLYGLLLESGNDAAIALAEYCSGSVEEFAKLMNSTAKVLVPQTAILLTQVVFLMKIITLPYMTCTSFFQCHILRELCCNHQFTDP